MPRRSGTTTPQQQPPSIRKDDAGISTTIPWESTDPAQLANLLNILDGLNIAYDYSSSFGKTRLAITYPYDYFNASPLTYANDLWEFFAQKVEKDLLTVNLPIGANATYDFNGNMTYAGSFQSFQVNGNNQFINAIGQLSQNDANLVRIAQQQQQQGFVIGVGWFTNPTDTSGAALTYIPVAGQPPVAVPSALNPTGCFTILTLILRGQSSAPVFAPVLRHTRTVTSQYAIQASLLNAGHIISTSSMAIIESVPNDLLFRLPNNYNPPSQYLVLKNDLVWGWFKDFPTIRQIARLKWNIVQEWQYGLYPVTVYGQLL